MTLITKHLYPQDMNWTEKLYAEVCFDFVNMAVYRCYYLHIICDCVYFYSIAEFSVILCILL